MFSCVRGFNFSSRSGLLGAATYATVLWLKSQAMSCLSLSVDTVQLALVQCWRTCLSHVLWRERLIPASAHTTGVRIPAPVHITVSMAFLVSTSTDEHQQCQYFAICITIASRRAYKLSSMWAKIVHVRPIALNFMFWLAGEPQVGRICVLLLLHPQRRAARQVDRLCQHDRRKLQPGGGAGIGCAPGGAPWKQPTGEHEKVTIHKESSFGHGMPFIKSWCEKTRQDVAIKCCSYYWPLFGNHR